MSRPPEFLTGTHAWDDWEALGAIPPPGHHDRSPGLAARTRNRRFCYVPGSFTGVWFSIPGPPFGARGASEAGKIAF